jgi:hypothetical protein
MTVFLATAFLATVFLAAAFLALNPTQPQGA